MSGAITEVRLFLAGLSGSGTAPTHVPQALRALVHRVARDRHDPDDLLQDLLADLLVRTRKRQPGGVAELLRLDDGQLLGALRRRAMQARATQQGSRSRLVKSLRAHVRAALEGELPAIDTLPLTLVLADRLSRPLVRQAVAYLVSQAEGPPLEPSTLAAQLLDLFFTARPEDVRAEVHGEGEADHEHAALAHVDAGRHVEALRHHLGPELTRVAGLRAQGKGLAEIAAGCAGVSTTHEKLGKATLRIREYAERHAVGRDDLEPVLQALAA